MHSGVFLSWYGDPVDFIIMFESLR
jgi:hypothetical protein